MLYPEQIFHGRACSPSMTVPTKIAGVPATVTTNAVILHSQDAVVWHLKFHQFGRCCQMRAVACRPDIIHCHDWPTAPVCYGDKGPSKSVFTIHNLNFGADLIGRAMQAAQVLQQPSIICLSVLLYIKYFRKSTDHTLFLPASSVVK